MNEEMCHNAKMYADFFYKKFQTGDYRIVQPPVHTFTALMRRCRLDLGSGLSALDFSCGEGRNTEYLVDSGYAVVATEVTQEALEAARMRFAAHEKNVDLQAIDLDRWAGKLAFDADRFDLIVAWDVLHWLASKQMFQTVVAEFARVLRPGGALIFTMPADSHGLKTTSVEVGESQYLIADNKRAGGVMYAPNKPTILKMIDDAGLQVECVMGETFVDGVDFTEERPFVMWDFCVRLAP